MLVVERFFQTDFVRPETEENIEIFSIGDDGRNDFDGFCRLMLNELCYKPMFNALSLSGCEVEARVRERLDGVIEKRSVVEFSNCECGFLFNDDWNDILLAWRSNGRFWGFHWYTTA